MYIKELKTQETALRSHKVLDKLSREGFYQKINKYLKFIIMLLSHLSFGGLVSRRLVKHLAKPFS